MNVPRVQLDGLDENKRYLITDLTPENADKPCSLHGKTFSGKMLKEEGIALSSLLKNEYSSLALELEAVE